MILKGASGLGDSIYIRCVAQHHLKQNPELKITVMSNYPDVFTGLPVSVIRHTKENPPGVQRISYCLRKYKDITTQWEDVCYAAGLQKDVEYSMPWVVKNTKLIDDIKKCARGKKVCMISGPFKPFGREDNFGKEITIDGNVIQNLINRNKDGYYFVRTCREKPLFDINGIDLDLQFKTTVTDLFDIVKTSNVCLGQIGYILPMCEVLNKTALIIFSGPGLKCGNKFLESIKPGKTIHKKSIIQYCIDTEAMDEINRKFIHATVDV